MQEIILVQHCQSEHHVNELSGGWTDTPLTELGQQQAHLIGTRLAKELCKDDYVMYASDFKRTWQTAQIVNNYLNLELHSEKALREINTGIAAGKTKEWAKQHRNPKTGFAFDLDFQEFPKGETWRQFSTRVCKCMEHIVASEKKNIIIVTHGGTLSFIIAWWLKFEESQLIQSYIAASPASISKLRTSEYYDQNMMTLLNDTSHLRDLSPN